jgi:glycosyltransferase involved in cell wall biosynthesis
MKVSVVVPAFNEERLLAQSLQSIRTALRAFEAPGWSSELIVCDNNSTDRTAAIAREAGATVVFEPINQISRARNTGAAQACGDWLVFVDADSSPTASLFFEVREQILLGLCLAGGATVTYGDTRHRAALAMAAIWNAVSRLSKWAAGSFIFCESASFREAGGFSEELFASEEIELFVRLKRMARRKGRSIVIVHRHPLLTSDRKLRLYGWREFFVFIAKGIVTGGRSLRSRSDCHAWYDGRR